MSVAHATYDVSKSKLTFPPLFEKRGLFLPGSLEYLSADQIGVDEAYQRVVNPRQVSKITKKFDPDLFGVLLISQRDGGDYFVIDGQHRLNAMILMEKGSEPLPCLVYTHLTLETEAKIFGLVNKERLYLSPQYTFRAQLIAKDPEALAIKGTVEQYGYHLNFWKPLPGDEGSEMWRQEGMISAIGEVRKLSSSYRMDMLGLVLSYCRDAWGTEAVGISANVMRGMAQFLNAYHGRFEEKRLLDILSNTTPKRLEAEGKDIFVASSPAGIQKFLWLKYNHGLGKGRRLPERNWKKPSR